MFLIIVCHQDFLQSNDFYKKVGHQPDIGLTAYILQFAGAARMERKGKLEEKSSSTYGTQRAILLLGKKEKFSKTSCL